MSYFQAYLPSLDEAIVAAWDSQLAEVAEVPWLAQVLTKREEIFPRFADTYAQLRKLPRGARRALQRRLAQAVAPEWQRKLAGSLAGAALLLALGQSTAQAAIINVDTTSPRVNNGDGFCSLIEAIINANNDNQSGSVDCPPGSGPDTIALSPASIHSVKTNFGSNTFGRSRLPDITSDITIDGNASTIKRSGKSNGRIFYVTNTGTLTLNDVTISNGRSKDGAGILNNGNLTINGSTISGNIATGTGGGILNQNLGAVSIVNSIVTGNKARVGGGISSSDNLSIDGTIVSNNRASSRGGGLETAGTVTVSNSSIMNNKARFGGGIYHSGSDLTIDTTTVSGNTASRMGGGIINYGTLTFNDSDLSGNKARFGGGLFNLGIATIDPSTVSGNTATGHRVSFGGGIVNAPYASLTVVNTSISGNRARAGGGVINLGYFRLDSSTITANTAGLIGGGVLNVSIVSRPPYSYFTFIPVNGSIVTGNYARFYGDDIYNYYI